MAKPTIRINEASAAALKELAEEKDQTITEVAEAVIAAGLAAMSLGQVHTPSSESALSEETLTRLTEWATAHNMGTTEAGDRLINVGINRLAALDKDKAKAQEKAKAKKEGAE